MRDFTSDLTALALNTATLGHILEGHGVGWSPEQVIDACATRGISGIVFWRRELCGRAVAIGDYARAAGVEVVGLCRSPFLVGPQAHRDHQAVMDEVYESIDTAAELQSSCLTVVVGGVEPGTRGLSESLKLVAERVATAAPYAAERGVQLALEPLHPVYAGDRSCLVSIRDAVDLCNIIGEPNVGIAVDIYHVWWDQSLQAELNRAGADRLLGFHLCDWLAQTEDILLDRGMMGDGVADIKAIRSSVECAGYSGYCEVEIFSAENWWNLEPNTVLDTIVERFQSVC